MTIREDALFLERYIREHLCETFYLGSIKVDPSPRRRASRGGMYKSGPGISIATHYWSQTIGPYRFLEYPSFNEDPQIGGFYSNDTSHALKALVAHETSHALQRWREYEKHLPPSKPHGQTFKNIYRTLREVLVNPFLPDQTIAEKEFRDLRKWSRQKELGFV